MSIELTLTNGQVALIDECDSDLLKNKWHVSNNYVYRGRARKHGERALHRIIWERISGKAIPYGFRVDHANRNPLDNRRSNLRIATNSQNMANKPMRPNKSGYRGVNETRHGKWAAKVGGTHLGCFDTPELAYAEYCKAAKERWGEFFSPD
jgi:hypothetical protein